MEVCRAVLNGMYTQAVRNEIIQKNPVTNAVLPRDNKRHTANVMSLKEQQIFLEYAKNTRYYPLSLIHIFSLHNVAGVYMSCVRFCVRKIDCSAIDNKPNHYPHKVVIRLFLCLRMEIYKENFK